jgi:3-hydroxymyristoyl/3-hydroxydecanoyl-(acyl carrier protein) dehydratase
MSHTLLLTEIKEYLPHRQENILLDSCKIIDESSIAFSLSIKENDPLNRTIFYKNIPYSVLPNPILAEITALGSIVSSGKIEPGTFAYFAAITNFKCTQGPFKGNKEITGTTKKLSSKNNFYKYKTTIENGESTAEANLMAFHDKSAQKSNPEPISLDPDIELALTQTQNKITPSTTKPNEMTFIHTNIPLNTNHALYSYQYPSTHSLTNGHFPNNPIMMGVCQWLMLEDAINHLISTHPLHNTKNNVQTSCNATIFKKDRTLVCEIKQATLISKKLDSNTWDTNTNAVKKILFKQLVVPNDTLWIHISNIETTNVS